jgi:hypothetical protein
MAPTHLALVPLLDGQNLVSDALTHVTLATTPSRRQRQQHQARQLRTCLIHLREDKICVQHLKRWEMKQHGAAAL